MSWIDPASFFQFPQRFWQLAHGREIESTPMMRGGVVRLQADGEKKFLLSGWAIPVGEEGDHAQRGVWLGQFWGPVEWPDWRQRGRWDTFI